MIDLRLKYGTNNIPIVSNETIDEHAELLIGDYDSSLLSMPQAMDVEDFAENYLRLHFHFTDLSHNGFIWGRMVFNDAKIIVYNPDTRCPDEEPVEGSTIVIDNGLLDEKKEHAFGQLSCMRAVMLFIMMNTITSITINCPWRIKAKLVICHIHPARQKALWVGQAVHRENCERTLSGLNTRLNTSALPY